MMSLSDWRDRYIDLTSDGDNDEDSPPLPSASAASRPTVPLPGSNVASHKSTNQAKVTYTHVPLPANESQSPSNLRGQQIRLSGTSTSSPTAYTTAATAAGVTLANGASPAPYVPVPGRTYGAANDGINTEQLAKRRKIAASSSQKLGEGASIWSEAYECTGAVRPLQQTHVGATEPWAGNSTPRAQPGPAVNRSVKKGLPASMANKPPSVQYMNAALKTNGATTSLLNEVAGSGPRPLQIGRKTDDGGLESSISHSMTVNENVPPSARLPISIASENAAHHKQVSPSLPTFKTSNQGLEESLRSQACDDSRKYLPWQATLNHSQESACGIGSRTRSSIDEDNTMDDVFESYYSTAEAVHLPDGGAEDDGHLSDASASQDSVILDAPNSNDSISQAFNPDLDSAVVQPSLIVRLPIASWSKSSNSPPLTREASDPRITTPQPSVAERPARPKYTNHLSEEEEHLLIFLKEVKKFKWKDITTEFQTHYPSRSYTMLQSRYTTSINKRNRSEDPATLKLPAKWAHEATIDWPSVHAGTAQPSKPAETVSLSRGAGQVSKHTFTSRASKPSMVRQLTDNDYSSGDGINMHVGRPRRAPLVNYDIRRRGRRLAADLDKMDLDEGDVEELAMVETPARSDCPSTIHEEASAKAHVVINPPLELVYDAYDAAVALQCRNSKGDKLPYLAVAERLSLQNSPDSWEWNQLASRTWQGTLVHVDFSPVETARVERALAKDQKRTQRSRHSTQRRQVRSMLQSLTEPRLSRLASDLQRCLPAREKISILAFLNDGRAGKLPDSPQILRLSAARPQRSMATIPNESTPTMLRERELGLQSRRGRKAASRTLTYPVKNKVMDTLGPSAYWTGASSDIHTLAWSPDGECFAAGAVAVTDQDSMQYNRPNNLLFGNLICNEIHELPCHSLARPIPATGANSTRAMFVSQDPKLYTTVTSVAFGPCGRRMYSAGYDKSLCIWSLDPTSSQPELEMKLKRGEEVEMMAVNQHEDGVIAIASRKIEKAIRLVRRDEHHPRGFRVHNFQSEKATSRPDLKILPQTLRFEPRFGTLLLAGFGANAREDNSPDTTGDLCLWDIETHAQMSIWGSNKNVFDVTFNPNQRSMPLFAAGCVAGGNVNRGTRSVIRLFEDRTMDKYTSPLEIECRALDMNDVVWCPQDEHLIAAGCTDARVYVWDLRKADHPLQILSHGPSLMPLPDDIPQERTDTGVRFLSWGDNATRLYSGSSDGIVKTWDVTQSVEDTFIKDLITADSGVMGGAFSPDFSKLLIGEVNGSVDVLEVGMEDRTTRDADKLRYVPYYGDTDSEASVHGLSAEQSVISTSRVIEGDDFLRSQELQIVPMGDLPIRQVVQGPSYAGPFDRSVDAPALRQQALEFQMSLTTTPGTQCNIPSCKDNVIKITSEESGDSGRSIERIPDELRRRWLAASTTTGIVPGKAKCTHCGRPALPSIATSESDGVTLCERCSFACFRCGAANAVAPAITTIICDFCAGVWEAGALGFECVVQPISTGTNVDVPHLHRLGREMLEDFTSEGTTYGDDMNALSDYYFSLAIDRPDSPPL